MSQRLNGVKPGGFYRRETSRKTIPTVPAKPNDNAIAQPGIYVFASSAFECAITKVRPTQLLPDNRPRSTVLSPQSEIASVIAISLRRRLCAALFLVRSDIETSIMFIMPTPPTKKQNADYPAGNQLTTSDILLKVCIALLREST